MPDGYALVMAILKLLKWVEEKLPDKPGLGLILLVTSAVIVGLTPVLFSQEDLGPDATDLESVWFFLGALLLFWAATSYFDAPFGCGRISALLELPLSA
jgi:hypothetical protein